MKLSEQWLREWVSHDLSTDELSEQLTMAGFEVDDVVSCQAEFSGVIVGKIEDVKAHPDADRLRICEVNTGGESCSVVCGAENARSGENFAFAPVGAVLPDGTKIKKSKLRGVPSAGMLCSAAELGLSQDTSQLLQLDQEAEAGLDLAKHLILDDNIFELSLTPNRGDCLSLAGIAREVATLNDLPVSRPEFSLIQQDFSDTRQIHLQKSEACPRYAGRIIKGVDMSAKTPDWILERLRRADLRSVNIVVDLTNYVMLELGQPMHAFDNDKLSGDITVRMAAEEEELTLLDGQHCQLNTNTLLICDDKGPVAMAGIMGGLDTAVSADTRDLFLESAYFDPQSIAGRARGYGLHTDASHRYERGVDFKLQESALERLSYFIVTYCGGSAGPIHSVADEDKLPSREAVALKMTTLSRVLGVEFEKQWVVDKLESLGLAVASEGDTFIVEPPSHRFDITIEADLVEEVARLYGYNNMPSAAPVGSLSMHGSSDGSNWAELRVTLLNRGYNEAITYSFVEQSFQDRVLGPQQAIALANPISSDLAVMRCSLLPGLIKSCIYNQNRQQERIRLFEIGKIFTNLRELEQISMIGGIVSGKVNEKQWDRYNTLSDFYDIKSDVEALIAAAAGAQAVEYHSIQHPGLHPGQSSDITLNNQVVGAIGALNPGLARDLGIKQSAFVFEINLELISSKLPVKFTKISKYPAVNRDIALLVNKDISLAEVEFCVKNATSEDLINLELFDVYQGEGIDSKKKSLALGLTFQRSSSTLTEEEVESAMSGVLAALHSKYGATLRE